MSSSGAERLQLPVEPYNVKKNPFRKILRRWVVLWAVHLGDDVIVPAGTRVNAIGDGSVVWSEMRLGDELRRNWGGVIVIEHQAQVQNPNDKFQIFYSVYGHMRDLQVKVGDRVAGGQQIGIVAESYTPENGWCKVPHVHFSIYVGPWKGEVPPGYKRVEESRTKVKWWRDPRTFIEQYNQQKL
jgi:murein DD-endopeptidase MepM/ murein hydrolase activator NlpD